VFSVLNSSGAILIEPPKKIIKTFYMCDKYFHLEPILEMFKDPISYGIVFITGDAFYIYKITKTGDHYESKELYNDDVELAKKHKKGGQSAGRFFRLRLESIHNYITKVSEKVIMSYLSNNNTKYLIQKLIIAGPGEKKVLLSQNELIQQYFKNNITLLNTTEINDQSIHEIINNAHELFENDIDDKCNDVINKIKNLMNQCDDKLVFGIKEIIKCLSHNELQQIITTEKIANEIDIEKINKNNKCEIIIVDSRKLEKMGLDIIGLRWY